MSEVSRVGTDASGDLATGTVGRRHRLWRSSVSVGAAAVLCTGLVVPVSAQAVTPTESLAALQTAVNRGGIVALSGDVIYTIKKPKLPEEKLLVFPAGTSVTLDLHGYKLSVTGPGAPPSRYGPYPETGHPVIAVPSG